MGEDLGSFGKTTLAEGSRRLLGPLWGILRSFGGFEALSGILGSLGEFGSFGDCFFLKCLGPFGGYFGVFRGPVFECHCRGCSGDYYGVFFGGGGFRVGVPPHHSPRWSGSSCTSWNWGAEPPPWPCFSSALVTTAGVFSWLVIYGGGPGGARGGLGALWGLGVSSRAGGSLWGWGLLEGGGVHMGFLVSL